MRSKHKDSFPGLWDVAAAGHIEIGEEPLTAALREIKEELGLEVHANSLKFIDKRQFSLTSQNGKFINNEITWIYTHDFRESLDELAPNVISFNVEYFDGTDWIEIWDDDEKLPKAVEITMILFDADHQETPIKFSKLVFINTY